MGFGTGSAAVLASFNKLELIMPSPFHARKARQLAIFTVMRDAIVAQWKLKMPQEAQQVFRTVWVSRPYQGPH